MNQSASPSIREFLRVIWLDWGTLMSGILTVPFTILAVLLPSGYFRHGFGVMAVLAFLWTAYRIWVDERQHRLELEHHLAPRLRIEFDPNQPKFVLPTPTVGEHNMLYARVLARAVSPVVKNCRAYLRQVSQWDGERYVVLFDEPLLLPWSYENPKSIQAKELNHDVDAFLDIAWFIEPRPSWFPFGLLNLDSILPTRLQEILLNQVIPYPERNLKLDVLLTGADSENATLSLNIHRGQQQWDKPQIGWMDSMGMIRREANY